MSEVEWSEESEEAPRKKRGIPKWVWLGCGGGCLVALILAVVLVVLGFKAWDKMRDPEYTWENVVKILPYDERPEGYQPVVGMGIFGQSTFVFEVGELGTVMNVQSVANHEGLDMQFDPDSMVNKIGITDTEVGTIELQGRETRVMRLQRWAPDSDEGEGGGSIRVDVTGDGSVYAFVEIISNRGDGSVSDELVQDILEPFDVWRGK